MAAHSSLPAATLASMRGVRSHVLAYEVHAPFSKTKAWTIASPSNMCSFDVGEKARLVPLRR